MEPFNVLALKPRDGVRAEAKPEPPAPPAAADDGPELYWYRVIFESGMPETGSSDLDPAAFEKAVFEPQAGARVQWKDAIDEKDPSGKPTGKVLVGPGGSFRPEKVMSVRWIERPE